MPFPKISDPRVTHNDKGDTRVIQYRWLSPTSMWFVTVPICLFGLPGLLVVQVDRMPIENEWFCVALLVVIWIVLTYCYLAKLYNSSWLAITPDVVTVRHGPLPWSGGTALERSTIEGFAVRERWESQNDDGAVSHSVTYEIVAIVDGREVPLLSRFYEREFADEMVGLARRHLIRIRESEAS